MVRLKGGDPFIFGRGGRAGDALRGGHPLLRCAWHYRRLRLLRLFGDPLTHRDFAQGVRLVTGHLKTGGELDWANLAVEKQTWCSTWV